MWKSERWSKHEEYRLKELMGVGEGHRWPNKQLPDRVREGLTITLSKRSGTD